MQILPDRALKERVIGAAVLVVVAVLIVPVFLDGPPQPSEIVTQSVTLPGQNGQARQQKTIVLERDRDEPVPAATLPGDALEASPPASRAESQQAAAASAEPPAATQPASGPAPAGESPPATARSETGMWAVQLGSFSSQANAEKLAAALRAQGYAAFISQLQTASGSLHRVRVGPQKDRESAEAIAAQLAKSGHKGQVVPHP